MVFLHGHDEGFVYDDSLKVNGAVLTYTMKISVVSTGFARVIRNWTKFTNFEIRPGKIMGFVCTCVCVCVCVCG